jgi:hypothetical protein
MMRSRHSKVWSDFEINNTSAELGISGNANRTKFWIRWKGAKKPLISVVFHTNTLARIFLEGSRILNGAGRDTREYYK